MLKTIDRYILKEIIPLFIIGVVMFTFFLLTQSIIKSLDLFINRGVGLGAILHFQLLALPWILVLTIPMSVLLSILLAFSRFSSDSEIIAFKANGISLLRLYKPVLAFGLATWLITLFIFMYLLPSSNHSLRKFRVALVRSRANVGIKPYVFNQEFQDIVLYVDGMSHDSITLKNIFLYDERDAQNPKVIVAREAEKFFNTETNKVTMRLRDGAIHLIPADSENKYIIDRFQLNEINLTDAILRDIDVPKGDRDKTVGELLQTIKERAAKGFNTNPQWVELHKKFSIPFACLVFTLVGLPLGITSRRGGKSSGFALSMLLYSVYYFFLTGGEGVGDSGKIPPAIAIWSPNIFLGLIGLYIFVKIAKEKPFKWVNYIIYRITSVGAKIKILINKTYSSFHANERHREHDHLAISSRKAGFFPNIIDRYVSREFLKLFAATLFIYFILAMIIHFSEKVDDFQEHGASILDAIKYLVYKVLYFTSFAIHYSVLLASLLALGSFNKNNELTAIKTSGVSLYRTVLPIIMLAGLIGGLYFAFNEKIIPITQERASYILDTKIKGKPPRSFFAQNRRWFKGKGNKIFYYLSFNPTKKMMSGFSFFEFYPDMTIKKRVEANNLIWEQDNWYFLDGREIKFDKNGAIIEDSTFDKKPCHIEETPRDFNQERKESEEMNYRELKEYIQVLTESGYDATPFVVDLHQKISFCFLSLILAITAVPFATRHNRLSNPLVGVGISLGIAIVYFIIYRLLIEYGHGGLISPTIAAWGANVLFLAIGLVLFFKTPT